MTSQELYELLELPREVIGMLNSMSPDDLPLMTDASKALYLNRATAGDGLKDMQVALGEDPDGMKLLWVLLEMARETWEGYVQRRMKAWLLEGKKVGWARAMLQSNL